ncbi:MAG: site-2 protease family protein, partial [Phycisphaerae bacterium]
MHGLMAHASWADGLVALAGPLRVLDGIWPYVVILLGFSLIVFVHELGHFSVAKWAGVKVERFAIGFGRELFGFTRGETRYSFNILPLGGYVKMLGQEDFDDKSKEL